MPGDAALRYVKLQWGRNFIVAETGLQDSGHSVYRGASMGPQLYRCGNNAQPIGASDVDPSFNGAATLSLRKPAPRWYRPSLLMVCFNGAATLSLRKLLPGVGVHRVVLLASMGPQLYRCGNCSRASACIASSCWLQWGRNFIVAETSTGRLEVVCEGWASMGPQLYRCGNLRRGGRTNFFIAMLQWGRNFIVAETAPGRRRASRRPAGFNGAATLSLRKLLPGVGVHRVVLLASMGPQLYRCGNLHRTA